MNIEKLANDIANWIKQYCETNGIKSLVVGVSGGIDSSVVASLCVRTGIQTILISIPMDLERDKDAFSKANKLCVKLEQDMLVFEISNIIEAYKKAGLGINFGNNNGKLEEGNLRSMIRADILYTIASRNNGIVMGTGNKDEDEIGYFTKKGDGATDANCLSDIHKSVVYKLGEFLGVPESILNAKPTAGLWDGQTDEDELGMTYDEVEWAIKQDELMKNEAAFDKDGNWIIVKKYMLEEKSYTSRQKEVLAKVRHMRKKNAHKLAYPPVFKVDMENYNG